MRFFLLKIVFILVFILSLENTTSAAFPFRNIKEGDTLPDFCVTSYGDSAQFCSKTIDKITIMIFWGADIPLKEKRSIKTFKAFEKIKNELQKRNIKIIAINVQNDPKEKVKDIIQKNKISFPMFWDKEREAYKKLGIYVIPSVLIIDKNKKVITGIGYTRKIAQITLGEIKVYLKEQTKEELERELHPEIKKKRASLIKAKRHLAMGKVLLKRNLPQRAIAEFKKALEIDKNLPEAHIYLGCSYIQLGKVDEGIKELELGLKSKETIEGLICLAKAKATIGQTEEAIADLESLILRNQRNPELFFTLGELYEKKQNFKKAAEAYKKAYLILHKRETK
ncbi:redoxin domain-containing protein [Thermodesulfatator atlanticus]